MTACLLSNSISEDIVGECLRGDLELQGRECVKGKDRRGKDVRREERDRCRNQISHKHCVKSMAFVCDEGLAWGHLRGPSDYNGCPAQGWRCCN